MYKGNGTAVITDGNCKTKSKKVENSRTRRRTEAVSGVEMVIPFGGGVVR